MIETKTLQVYPSDGEINRVANLFGIFGWKLIQNNRHVETREENSEYYDYTFNKLTFTRDSNSQIYSLESKCINIVKRGLETSEINHMKEELFRLKKLKDDSYPKNSVIIDNPFKLIFNIPFRLIIFLLSLVILIPFLWFGSYLWVGTAFVNLVVAVKELFTQFPTKKRRVLALETKKNLTNYFEKGKEIDSKINDLKQKIKEQEEKVKQERVEELKTTLSAIARFSNTRYTVTISEFKEYAEKMNFFTPLQKELLNNIY